MTGLSNQKRIAAEVLNVGLSRVWLDPDKLTDVANAITREDIRGLIEEGTVKARQAQGISRGRARGNDAKHAGTMQSAREGTGLDKGLAKEEKMLEALRSTYGCGRYERREGPFAN